MTIGSILGLIVFAGMVVFACRHLHKHGGTAVNDFRRKQYFGKRMTESEKNGDE